MPAPRAYGAGTAFAAYPWCSTDNGVMRDERTAREGVVSVRSRASQLIVGLAALAVGSAVAWVDSRPNRDDAGVTAALLLAGGSLSAGVGLPWWTATILVGGPVVLIEARSAG